MRSLKAIKSLQKQDAARLVLLAGFLTGIAWFIYYYSNGLTTTHYDAKAHLLVARRMVDSITPGYSQLGANWLPLIHLVYLPLVVFESQYRSGLLPSLISICAFALSGYLAYRISFRVTGSVAAGVFAGIVLLGNANLQYLQSCPLTEPMFMALFLLAADSLLSWRDSGCAALPWRAAIWTSLGALCRYEGWYFFGGVMLLLVFDFWKGYAPKSCLVKGGAVFIAVFGAPAIAHFGYIFFRLGDTFFGRLAQGYHTPYITYKRPFLSLWYHLGELSQVATTLPLIMAAAGLVLLFSRRKQFLRRIPLFLLWLPSLINISALYWGLIYRVRYSVLLIPAVAIFGSLVIESESARKRLSLLLALATIAFPWLAWCQSMIRPGSAPIAGPGALVLPVAALILFLLARVRSWYSAGLTILCVLGMQVPLLSREDRPMMVETMEHEFIEPERKEVLQFLRRHYDGKRILIDMGTEAPLVYDSGFDVKEYVYNEGGESLWHSAAQSPDPVVGWICTQDADSISQHMNEDPNWARNYSVVLKTEHYRLYRLR